MYRMNFSTRYTQPRMRKNLVFVKDGTVQFKHVKAFQGPKTSCACGNKRYFSSEKLSSATFC